MFLGYSKGSVRPNFVVTNGRLKAEGSKLKAQSSRIMVFFEP
jgi:hypothetical protein